MYATDFEYDGERLSEHGMMICSFDGIQDETVSSGADITFNCIKPSTANQFKLYSSTYEEAYTTTFQICKNVCDIADAEDLYLTTREISSLQRWLCRHTFHQFHMLQDGYEDIFWVGSFSSKQILRHGKTVGLELTLVTDAPYAYGVVEDTVCDVEVDKNGHVVHGVEIYDLSDEVGYVYPDLEITIGNVDGKVMFRLENYADLECNEHKDMYIMQVKNCTAGETLIINGKNQIITSDNLEHTTLSEDFNYYFPRVINTYDNDLNYYVPNVPCTIKLAYSSIRKVGL